MNSARSDASGRNTYRELAEAMRQEGEKEGSEQDPEKSSPTAVAPIKNGSKTVDEVSTKLLQKYSGTESEVRPLGEARGRVGQPDHGALSPEQVNQQNGGAAEENQVRQEQRLLTGLWGWE